MGLSNFKYGISSMGVPFPGITAGKVFYVDLENGSDVASGLDTSHPRKTLNGAMDLCVANRGDIVYVFGKGSITSAQVLDVAGVTVIGIPNTGAPTGNEPRIKSSGALQSLVVIDSNKITVDGIRFDVAYPGQDAIRIGSSSASHNQCLIRNLNIAIAATAKTTPSVPAYGINVAAVLVGSTIENISINSSSSDAYGIGGAGSTLNNIVRKVYARGEGTSGIYLNSSTSDIVENCRVVGFTDSITVTGASSLTADNFTDVTVAGTSKESNSTAS